MSLSDIGTLNRFRRWSITFCRLSVGTLDPPVVPQLPSPIAASPGIPFTQGMAGFVVSGVCSGCAAGVDAGSEVAGVGGAVAVAGVAGQVAAFDGFPGRGARQ